ncbi:MAG: hypothetical protein ACQKBW_11720 [Puniceicoccales bacterium]
MTVPTSKLKHLILAGLFIAASIVTHADVIVSYGFDGASSLSEMLEPSSVANNVAASSIAENNVTVVPQHSFVSDPDNRLAAKANITTSSLSVSSTLSNETYFSFTLTPDAGQQIAFDSLTFTAQGGGSSVYRAFYVFSSATGFEAADVLESGIQEGEATDTLNSTGETLYTITFSSLVVTSETEFRFYIDSDSTGRTVIFDDITVNGTVSAVPEASTTALVIGVLAILATLIRRRAGSLK